MSMPHQFSDDPKAFHSPPPPSNNNKTVLIVVIAILGVVMLMCGGLITAGVLVARTATQEFGEQFEQEFGQAMQQMQAEMQANQQQMVEYQSAMASGDYQTALDSTNEWLENSPDDATAHNNKAWLLATCPVEEFRDGKLAVEHATKACELTDWNFAGFIDTLAAAHAEEGDFEAAAEWQQKAIDADTDNFFTDEFQQRLTLYKSGEPYREDPQAVMNLEMEGMQSAPGGFFSSEENGVEAVESVFDEAGPTTTQE